MAKEREKGRTRQQSGVVFNHAMVYVADVERSLRFYQELLGLRLIEKLPGYARLRSPAGGTTLALHKLGEGVSVAQSDGIRLYFETRGLEAVCQRLAGAGVEFKQMPQRMPWGWKHAYLKDPDGYEVSLYWAGALRLRSGTEKRLPKRQG